MSSRKARANAQLFVLSAPSGTGKTTLIKRAFTRDWPDGAPPEFSVSHTTRAPRPDEVDGQHYHFISEDEFQRMVAEGAFLEWAVVHGQLKGTSRAEVDSRLAAGVDVLLDIDVQGVASIADLYPDACTILILPPGFDELRRRIINRGHDSPEDVSLRLSVSLWEIERYGLFDCVIVNDDIERASHELTEVLSTESARSEFDEERVQTVLKDFRDALGHPPHDTQQFESRLEISDGPNSRQD